MASIITTSGNVVNTPELRSTTAGVSVTSFRLAVNERRRDAEGNYQDAGTAFFTVTAFRALAESLAETLKVGDPVVVSGRLKPDNWVDANGHERVNFEIQASQVGSNLRFGGLATRKRAGRPPSFAEDSAEDLAALGVDPADDTHLTAS